MQKQARQVLNLLTPHETQIKYLLARQTHRFRISAWGRQSGKSTIANNEIIGETWRNKNHTYWFMSPTYDNAAVQYDRMLWNLRNCIGVIKRKSDSDLYLETRSDSTLWYKSGEILENLRSETLNGVVVDEVRNQHPKLWSMVLRPMLATTKGWGSFISTPNGFDHFYDLWNDAEALGWFRLQAPSTCNPLIDEREMQDAKLIMTPEEFAQEYGAEFVNIYQGKAYHAFSVRNMVTENPISTEAVHPMLPVIVGLDFNVNPMAWTLSQKRVDTFYVFDEIFIKNTHTEQAARVLVERLIEHHPHIKKVGVILCGDASGNANKTSASGKTDYDLVCMALDEAGIPWTNVTPDANPPVKDRVNTVNSKLCNANNEVNLFIHERCKNLRKDFERVAWKEGATGAILDQKTDPMLTHLADSVGYVLMALSPLRVNSGSTTLRVVRR